MEQRHGWGFSRSFVMINKETIASLNHEEDTSGGVTIHDTSSLFGWTIPCHKYFNKLNVDHKFRRLVVYPFTSAFFIPESTTCQE